MGRGSLTLWIDEEVIQNWKTPVKTGQPGASKTYSDVCITACLSLGLVMKLPLGQCCGLVCSVLALMGVNLPCPDPSTLSRRRRGLCVDMGVKASPCSESCPSEGRHIVVDSTGLKIYGEGEWKVRKHGVGKRRTWRKMHLSIDADTGEILACLMSEGDAADGPLLKELVEASEQAGGRVKRAAGDGAYDSWDNDEYLARKGIEALIPPCRGSKIRQKQQRGVDPLPRDERLRAIRRLGGGNFEYGRRRWALASDYSRRSLAETGMMRQKVILGPGLRSREEPSQRVECLLRCRVLNKMTGLGMPDSYAVCPGNSPG